MRNPPGASSGGSRQNLPLGVAVVGDFAVFLNKILIFQ
jgi:hypothetical protein